MPRARAPAGASSGPAARATRASISPFMRRPTRTACQRSAPTKAAQMRRRATAALTLGLTVGLAVGLTVLAPRPARADEAAGHYTLALQYKREGKVPDAIAECQKALEIRPDYAAAHLTLGNLY